MPLSGICEYCRKISHALQICTYCGKRVCLDCINSKTHMCKSCEQSK